MRLYRENRRFPFRALAAVVLFAAAIGAFYLSVNNAALGAGQEAQKNTERAIARAIVNCYAVEGVYPQSIAYLEEHYGVQIDHSRFDVNYQIVGDNVKPYFELVEVGAG